MKISAIKIGLHRNENGTHHMRLIDVKTEEEIVRGEDIPQTQDPVCNYEDLQFEIHNNKAYIEFQSLQAFINKAVLTEQIKIEENGIS